MQQNINAIKFTNQFSVVWKIKNFEKQTKTKNRIKQNDDQSKIIIGILYLKELIISWKKKKYVSSK